jgi:hypothetical protein
LRAKISASVSAGTVGGGVARGGAGGGGGVTGAVGGGGCGVGAAAGTFLWQPAAAMDRAALSAIVEKSRGTRIIVYSSVVAA